MLRFASLGEADLRIVFDIAEQRFIET